MMAACDPASPEASHEEGIVSNACEASCDRNPQTQKNASLAGWRF